MSLLDEAGGIKYDEMPDKTQELVDQKAKEYKEADVEVVDSLKYEGETHEDVAVAYIGEGTVPQLIYDNTDLENDKRAAFLGNAAAATIDKALQELDEEGVSEYIMVESGTVDPVSDEVGLMRPLGAVNDAAEYMADQEIDDRIGQYLEQVNEELETDKAQEFFEQKYKDSLEAAKGNEELVSAYKELQSIQQGVEEVDDEIVEEVNEATVNTDISLETVFSDSMKDYATVSLTDRREF